MIGFSRECDDCLRVRGAGGSGDYRCGMATPRLIGCVDDGFSRLPVPDQHAVDGDTLVSESADLELASPRAGQSR